MNKHYSRVRRGMVFWFNPGKVYNHDTEYTISNDRKYPSHLQLENRPWMVVSNDEGNSSSLTCNIVPITLEPKSPLPCHVKFMYEGKWQTILVEQMRTVDTMALRNYMYIVSDEVLRNVEKAIAVQYAIRPSISAVDFTLDKTLEKLEKIVEGIIQEKMRTTKGTTLSASQIEATALQLGQLLEDLCKDNLQEETSSEDSHKPTSHLSQVEKFNLRYRNSK